MRSSALLAAISLLATTGLFYRLFSDSPAESLEASVQPLAFAESRLFSGDEVDAFLDFYPSPRTKTDEEAGPDREGVDSWVPFAEGSDARWPPLPEQAQTVYLRAAVTRHARPPFGPIAVPLPAERDRSIESWERAYYETRPDEYERFAEFFGDIHGLL